MTDWDRDHVRETRQNMQDPVPWTLREDFESKIKEMISKKESKK